MTAFSTLPLAAHVLANLQSLGMEPQHSCGSTFGADMDRDAKAYTQLARALDLKAE